MESRSKSPLALMEQVIMVLVFALAAAICVEAFVKARTMSIQSRTRDRAVEICESAAEEYKATHLATTPKEVCYDGLWRVTEENYTYKMKFVTDKEDEYGISGKLIMMDEKNHANICQLKVAWQKEVADE